MVLPAACPQKGHSVTPQSAVSGSGKATYHLISRAAPPPQEVGYFMQFFLFFSLFFFFKELAYFFSEIFNITV